MNELHHMTRDEYYQYVRARGPEAVAEYARDLDMGGWALLTTTSFLSDEEKVLLQTAKREIVAITGQFSPHDGHDVHDVIRMLHERAPDLEPIVSAALTTTCRACDCHVLPGGERRHLALHYGG